MENNKCNHKYFNTTKNYERVKKCTECGHIKYRNNMYTTKNTKCSNFTCEIRIQCKRACLSVFDSITPYYCFAYSKKRKYCKSFIDKNNESES